MAYQYLSVRRNGPVEYVTLNRPEVRNAFNEGVVAELTAWAGAAAEDGELRVIVLAGAGTVFSAGADLDWLSRSLAYTQDGTLRDAAALGSMLEALDALPQVLIGRVHGAALGGGVGLAAICDIVVAAEDAVFGFTEVRLGIVPAVISPYVLAKIGASAARHLFLTGSRFSASRAREIGLVHTVVAAEQLEKVMRDVTRDVLACGPEAVASAKRLIRAVAGRAPSEVSALTGAALAERRASPEGQAGMRAFLQKQPPPWVVE
jgi:methylglutaconyl-CoA hydratase